MVLSLIPQIALAAGVIAQVYQVCTVIMQIINVAFHHFSPHHVVLALPA
jgi:hypothetical protein